MQSLQNLRRLSYEYYRESLSLRRFTHLALSQVTMLGHSLTHERASPCPLLVHIVSPSEVKRWLGSQPEIGHPMRSRHGTLIPVS